MTDRKVGPIVRALLHQFRTGDLTDYLCPAHLYCWKVKKACRITQLEAGALFKAVLDRDFAKLVSAAIGASLSRWSRHLRSTDGSGSHVPAGARGAGQTVPLCRE